MCQAFPKLILLPKDLMMSKVCGLRGGGVKGDLEFWFWLHFTYDIPTPSSVACHSNLSGGRKEST